MEEMEVPTEHLHEHMEHARYKPGTAGAIFRDWETDGGVDVTTEARRRAMERGGFDD